MSIIEVKKLSKSFKVKQKQSLLKDFFKPDYKEVNAVNDLSFSVEEGEAVAFLGPNGAGKTTTAKMLTGLLYPTSGNAQVLGYNPFEKEKEFLMDIGLVMGNKSGLNWDLSPKQNLEILKSIYNIDPVLFQEKIDELSELLDTKSLMNTQVRKLSLGERMKFELIRSIIHSPKLLFLDEPTIGLDIISKQKIRDFLKHIQQDYGVTLLLTSHDMADVEDVCNRVIVINHGQKVYDNNLNELKKQYSKTKFVRFVFDKDKPEITDNTDVSIIKKDKNSITYEVSSNKMSSFIAKVATKYNPEDIEILEIPLEKIIGDIFNKN